MVGCSRCRGKVRYKDGGCATARRVVVKCEVRCRVMRQGMSVCGGGLWQVQVCGKAQGMGLQCIARR